jgi:hypothetical protein
MEKEKIESLLNNIYEERWMLIKAVAEKLGNEYRAEKKSSGNILKDGKIKYQIFTFQCGEGYKLKSIREIDEDMKGKIILRNK